MKIENRQPRQELGAQDGMGPRTPLAFWRRQRLAQQTQAPLTEQPDWAQAARRHLDLARQRQNNVGMGAAKPDEQLRARQEVERALVPIMQMPTGLERARLLLDGAEIGQRAGLGTMAGKLLSKAVRDLGLARGQPAWQISMLHQAARDLVQLRRPEADMAIASANRLAYELEGIAEQLEQLRTNARLAARLGLKETARQTYRQYRRHLDRRMERFEDGALQVSWDNFLRVGWSWDSALEERLLLDVRPWLQSVGRRLGLISTE